MSNCVKCGAETIMYIEGVPVCVDCDNASKATQQREPERVVKEEAIRPASTYPHNPPNGAPGDGNSPPARRVPSLLVVSER